MPLEDRVALLVDAYGLDRILMDHDIEPAAVLRDLVESGELDIEEYFYEDMEDLDED